MGVVSAKSKILHAAACVVERAGAGHLTLDAVAEESKLSKGGLLYHFPNKRALLSGMLEHLLDRLQERAHEAQLATEASTVSALIQAQQTQDDDERAMGRALIAAAAEDPSLLEPAREVVNAWIAAVREESHYGVLLLLAVEGLRFREMLNLLDLAPAERARLYQQMAELAQEVAV
mgnify:FL=1